MPCLALFASGGASTRFCPNGGRGKSTLARIPAFPKGGKAQCIPKQQVLPSRYALRW